MSAPAPRSETKKLNNREPGSHLDSVPPGFWYI